MTPRIAALSASGRSISASSNVSFPFPLFPQLAAWFWPDITGVIVRGDYNFGVKRTLPHPLSEFAKLRNFLVAYPPIAAQIPNPGLESRFGSLPCPHLSQAVSSGTLSRQSLPFPRRLVRLESISLIKPSLKASYSAICDQGETFHHSPRRSPGRDYRAASRLALVNFEILQGHMQIATEIGVRIGLVPLSIWVCDAPGWICGSTPTAIGSLQSKVLEGPLNGEEHGWTIHLKDHSFLCPS